MFIKICSYFFLRFFKFFNSDKDIFTGSLAEVLVEVLLPLVVVVVVVFSELNYFLTIFSSGISSSTGVLVVFSSNLLDYLDALLLIIALSDLINCCIYLFNFFNIFYLYNNLYSEI